MTESPIMNIIFAGVGGQGNILVSNLLANAALEAGFPVRLTETFGAATRGGSVFSCLRIGDAGAPLPREHSVQIIVALEPVEGLRRAITYLAPGGWVITNTRPWIPVDVSTGRVEYPSMDQIAAAFNRLEAHLLQFDAMEIALDAGSSRMMNIVLLGGLLALDLLPLDRETVLKQIDQRWKKSIADMNQIAFHRGYEQVRSMTASKVNLA